MEVKKQEAPPTVNKQIFFYVYLGQLDLPVCNLVLNIAAHKQAVFNAFFPFIYQNLPKICSLTLIQALNQKSNLKQALQKWVEGTIYN
jgi:hypothetical protein